MKKWMETHLHNLEEKNKEIKNAQDNFDLRKDHKLISLKAEIDNLNRMISKLENEHVQNEELKMEMQKNLFAAQTEQRKLQEEMDSIKADHQGELDKQ